MVLKRDEGWCYSSSRKELFVSFAKRVFYLVGWRRFHIVSSSCQKVLRGDVSDSRMSAMVMWGVAVKSESESLSFFGRVFLSEVFWLLVT